MKKFLYLVLFFTLAFVIPCQAQGIANSLKGMNAVLDQVFNDMLPLCSSLINVGRGVAGFAAIFYIGVRVWKSIAAAQPIDFFPLFRPFVIAFCIGIFPLVISLINGILNPITVGTNAMVVNSDQAINKLLAAKEAALKATPDWQMYVGNNGSGDQEKWEKYMEGNNQNPNVALGMGSDIKFAMDKAAYNFKNSIKQWIHEVLMVLYAASSLIINTLRTFFLIVMVIIGPLAWGLSCFDGFQSTLTGWIARYINYFLWLPVANIFGAILGKIQENMLKLDLQQIGNSGQTFFSETDLAYLVFMCIGIAGYFAVPSVSNFIMQGGGGAGDGMLGIANRIGGGVTAAGSAGAGVAAGAGSAGIGAFGSRAASAASNIANAGKYYNDGQQGQNMSGSGYENAGSSIGHAGASLYSRLKG